ncbi:hypothetical protein T09_12594 [Trichinella sp. T9]|nr:hypothetical protein T09_12594 [Trichinella sp. T9]
MAKEFSPIFAYKQRNLFLNGIAHVENKKYLRILNTYQQLIIRKKSIHIISAELNFNICKMKN